MTGPLLSCINVSPAVSLLASHSVIQLLFKLLCLTLRVWVVGAVPRLPEPADTHVVIWKLWSQFLPFMFIQFLGIEFKYQASQQVLVLWATWPLNTEIACLVTRCHQWRGTIQQCNLLVLCLHPFSGFLSWRLRFSEGLHQCLSWFCLLKLPRCCYTLYSFSPSPCTFRLS